MDSALLGNPRFEVVFNILFTVVSLETFDRCVKVGINESDKIFNDTLG
jgi:hypothetical protein